MRGIGVGARTGAGTEAAAIGVAIATNDFTVGEEHDGALPGVKGTVATASLKGSPGMRTSHAQYKPCGMSVLPAGVVKALIASVIVCFV